MASLSLANVPAHLHQKGRHELIKHVMNIRNGIEKHKAVAKHAGVTLIGGTLATVGGAVAGGLAVKLPYLPKTKFRTDLVLGGAIGLGVALGVFDEHAQHVAAFSHGVLGYGTGDAVKKALLAKGVKQAA